MKRFWADKVLSAPLKKKISTRLRKKGYIHLRERISENLVIVFCAVFSLECFRYKFARL